MSSGKVHKGNSTFFVRAPREFLKTKEQNRKEYSLDPAEFELVSPHEFQLAPPAELAPGPPDDELYMSTKLEFLI